jgi:hypothetical protein
MMVVVMVMVVVTIIPAMVMMVMIPAMMMMVVVVVFVPIVILREFQVGVLLGLPLGARRAHRIGGDQQNDRIRDWLEQLRIRPGVQDFSHVLRPHRFHRGRRCKRGECAHKACDVLVHFDLPEKFMRVRKNHARSQLAHRQTKINETNGTLSGIPQFILRPLLRAHSKARVCATIPGAATPAAAVEIDRASSTRLWKITE